ncbi:hypothetical protein IU459_16235 [Nocardia amamiensis]|uniref:Uncharacterized protein n=1 Tax=Nocardia amamiensis TaxID=404578 RepID=A0ABS0CR35_9NOCA|nr:hypothetical protein [Nocardia amamiensis]MBF6299079.1 hypothetical protein [Nocardia amamiensis]
MEKSFEVVDDFYPNPIDIRERALALVAGQSQRNALAHQFPCGFVDREGVDRIVQLCGNDPISQTTHDTLANFRVLSNGALDRLPEEYLGNWVALIWLNLPEQCQGGFSHYTMPELPERASGTETMFVAERFNRLVLFKASSGSYADGPGFGADPESARLTQVITFPCVTS